MTFQWSVTQIRRLKEFGASASQQGVAFKTSAARDSGGPGKLDGKVCFLGRPCIKKGVIVLGTGYSHYRSGRFVSFELAENGGTVDLKNFSHLSHGAMHFDRSAQDLSFQIFDYFLE